MSGLGLQVLELPAEECGQRRQRLLLQREGETWVEGGFQGDG